MDNILQHLIDLPDDIEAYEPAITRAPIGSLIREPRNDRDAVKARTATVATLLQNGMEATMDDSEHLVATQQFHKSLQHSPMSPAALTKPAVVLRLSALLSEYDYEVVRDASQMRAYVTNRLLEESGPKQAPNVRLRALDLLGKISGVDLFTERTEVTVKTMPVENLEAKLYDKLKILLPDEYEAIANQNIVNNHG